jgi:hypothetical protein
MLKYIATTRFASYSPAKQRRIVAQMEQLDASLLELVAAFQAVASEPDLVPATFDKSLALTQQEHEACAKKSSAVTCCPTSSVVSRRMRRAR